MQDKREQALAVRTDRPMTDGYWAMMAVRDIYLEQPTPALDWPQPREDDPICESEQVIIDHINGAPKLLDVGAGDLRTKTRIQRFGFTGQYDTLDRSREFPHTYSGLHEVANASYDAVIALEIIEHIPLGEFDGFMDEVLRVLRPGGRLVISTPNAAFTSTIWEADMTHVHAYRLQDLAAYLHLRGVPSTIYRVVWSTRNPRMRERARMLLFKFITRKIMNADYARGVLVCGTREEKRDRIS